MFSEKHCLLSSSVVQSAKSTRAVTGGRCPYSVVGEEFLALRQFFFYKNDLYSEPKSLFEGCKRAIDIIWGLMAKNGFFWPQSEFLVPKKNGHNVLATTGQSYANKKKHPFPKISIF